ncbi:MAG: transcription termination/antitermination protein NusG [bacterium]
METKWFLLQVYTGYEKKAKKLIEAEAKINNLSDRIENIFIPSEYVGRIRKGKKVVVEKSIYPGYVFIEMEDSPEMTQFIAAVSAASTFISGRRKPVALKKSEEKMVYELLENKDNIREVMEIPFKEGDNVKITAGPFRDFTGVVEEIYEEREKMKITVTIFGRSTPVEISFTQAELIGN